MAGYSLDQRRRLLWGGLLASTLLVFGTVLSPPLLSPEWRAVVMRVFAPVCHQLPGRSLHFGGIQTAVCDRCLGIYLGLVVGVVTVGGGAAVWKYVTGYDRYVLLGSLVPLGLDWVGPVLGLWANVPISRAGTGLVFGVIAASFVTHRLLRTLHPHRHRPAELRESGSRVEETPRCVAENVASD